MDVPPTLSLRPHHSSLCPPSARPPLALRPPPSATFCVQVSDAFRGIPRAELRRHINVFRGFDADADGALNAEEFCEFLAKHDDMRPTQVVFDALFAKTDLDGDGLLDLNEWLHYAERRVKSAAQVRDNVKRREAEAVAKRKETAAKAAAAREPRPLMLEYKEDDEYGEIEDNSSESGYDDSFIEISGTARRIFSKSRQLLHLDITFP